MSRTHLVVLEGRCMLRRDVGVVAEAVPTTRIEGEGGRPLDGNPVPAATGTPVSAQVDEQDAASYRPGYERVAEEILRLIAELQLQPGDRMPTENQLASR